MNMLFGLITLLLAATTPQTAAAPCSTYALRELADGSHDGERVTVTGVADEFLTDDVDPGYKILRLKDGSDSILVSILTTDTDIWRAADILDATVSVKGIFRQRLMSERRFVLPRIVLDAPTDLTIVTPPSASPFDRPRLDVTNLIPPEAVAQLGRRTVVGTVIAAWQKRNLLLLVHSPDKFVRVELADSETLPPCGSTILAVGTVETDLFRYNLSRARFKVFGNKGDMSFYKQSGRDTVTLSADKLFAVRHGRQAFNALYYGSTLRDTGIVRTAARATTTDVLAIESQGRLLSLDVSAAPEFQSLPAGTKVAFSGTCIHEVPNWRPSLPLPQIEGVTIVLRRPEDLTVLSRPPWWTAGRLFAVIGGLLAVMGTIVAWNISLRRLAERRGRELTEETVARVTSELKVYERTRLAVELHDSLAQNLTGVSLEIDTANKVADDDPKTMHEQLNLASRSLKSCREELRYCLWDLRNRALESSDLAEAIRQTLAPHVGKATLHVRFSVPRDRVTDSTAHAMLRIIRELSVNAVRHGKATEIRVAGSIEGALLRFSVRDNGCGFDPKSVPGAAEGHFGLLGIRERIAEFEGDYQLESAPGHGTKVTLALHVPQEEDT